MEKRPYCLEKAGLKREESGHGLGKGIIAYPVTHVPPFFPSPLLWRFGDSISIHYWPYFSQAVHGWARTGEPAGREHALEKMDERRGNNCGDSRGLRSAIAAALEDPAFRPEIVILNAGLHDIKFDPASGQHQVPCSEYRENIHVAIQSLRQRGCQACWVQTTPLDDDYHASFQKGFIRRMRDVRAYNLAAAEVAGRGGAWVVALDEFTASLSVPWFVDHVHFLPEIRQAQGAYLARQVQSAWEARGQKREIAA